MTDDVVKSDQPTAQVFRLVVPTSRLEKLNKTNDDFTTRVTKDLGPTGGKNPDGTAVQPNAFESEDEYQQLYVGATRDQGVIQPPYNLRQLDFLSQQNNMLSPAIEAMVTNIDGTGYTFVSEDEEADDEGDDSKIDALKEFFAQPWPGMSFIELRKLLRRDLERVGNAFIEVLRNAQDKIVMLRRVDAKMMRLLRLDDAIQVDESLIRDGKEETITTMKRERRFCQLVNGVTLMYFKDFGASRDLHKKTAVWAPKGQKLPANQRASEIIHLTVILDSHTPYGVPRWINQTPSVLGSRKAEEFNLEFFDNGGVPPIMITLQGGTMQAQTRQAIEQMTAGGASKNNRLMVLEVEPNGGSLNQAGPPARVTVERFGSDRQKDAMFETYDEKCGERVLRAFRIPPIFLGGSKDYNFATAFASYTVAEAQVFKPERDEFDEIVTMKLLPAMGYDGYKLESKPLTIEDATLQLQGIEVISAMGDQVEPGDVVTEVNKITGTNLKVSQNAPTLGDKIAQQKQQQMMQAMGGMQQGGQTMDPNGNIKAINPQPKFPGASMPVPGSPRANGGSPGMVKPKQVPNVMGGASKPLQFGGGMKKADLPTTGQELAVRAMKALRKRDFGELALLLPIVGSFDEAGQANFNEIVSELAFVDTSFDPAGLAELSACTMAFMSSQPHTH